jgi:hypothetical protein
MRAPQRSVFEMRSVSAAFDTHDESAPILKMAERPDWALFRSVEGLCQKAGVPASNLRKLVLKEITDNALDAGGHVRVGEVDGHYFVADDGPGINGTPEEIADLFSIRRPMRSSKLWRLPQRGALGNGLRVVAGAVLASEGSLVVATRNQRIALRPESDGSTTVIEVTPAESTGTRIEIRLGGALPPDRKSLAWARAADAMAHQGNSYEGKASPFWYDPVQFHEVLLAYGSQPLRGLIAAQLDGCSGGKAGEIVSAAGLDRATCASINLSQATTLLEIARKAARKVSPERIGCVGRDAFAGYKHVLEHGTALMGSQNPKAEIPFVVEAWATKIAKKGDFEVAIFVNRTPITGEINAFRDVDKDLALRGCGLNHYFKGVPTKGEFDIQLNILTPYCPVTSDGKAPNLRPFVEEIGVASLLWRRPRRRNAPHPGKSTYPRKMSSSKTSTPSLRRLAADSALTDGSFFTGCGRLCGRKLAKN